jgi:hypothetical protein
MERLQGIAEAAVPESDLPSIRKASAYQEFHRHLTENFERARDFRNEPLIAINHRLPPHDLLYIYPEIRVYRRK